MIWKIVHNILFNKNNSLLYHSPVFVKKKMLTVAISGWKDYRLSCLFLTVYYLKRCLIWQFNHKLILCKERGDI